MNARRQAGSRLRSGSVRTYRRRAEQITGWVARARRDDLEGWKAALGSWLRLAGLAALGYAAYRACRAWPWLLWAAAGWWLLSAWRAGAPRKEDEKPADEDPPGPAPEAVGELLAGAVRAVAAGGPGAHLAALAEHLTETTRQPWNSAAVRAACQAAGIPVTGSARQTGRGVSTGVYLRDLPDPSPGPAPTPAVAVVVAGQNTPTGAATATATPAGLQLTVESGEGVTIIRDPTERRAYKV